MSFNEDSTCNSLFFDPNGLLEYDNFSDLVQTIYPMNQGSKVRVQFLDFALENHANCLYDYLEIHNGPSQVSPAFGKWCGQNSPGTLTSTHSSGALTFVFHSDDGVTASGWRAKLSCFSPLETSPVDSNPNNLQIFPNPGSGVYSFSKPEMVRNLKIFDGLGRELKNQTLDEGFEKGVDLRTFRGSVFLFRVETDRGVWVEKVIKEN
jgi:hypothetical protein